MSTEQAVRAELDARARQGETVIPGGTGGKSLEAQEHLAKGSYLNTSLNLSCTDHVYVYLLIRTYGLHIYVHEYIGGMCFIFALVSSR